MKYRTILINILIILGLMLIVSANVFIQQLSNLDEIWIYNFGRCILNGLLPYKDFSIIITPLFAYISAAFLRIFGNEMIVLRFAEIFQTAFILFMIYKILERIKVNQGISLLFAIGVYYIYSNVFCFDYNWAVLLFSLIILYMELKEETALRQNFKKDLFIGILAGITILLKQTSGIVLSAMIIFYKIIEIRSVKDFKQFFNIMLSRLLGVLLPILAFAIYLTECGIWTEFIDYAILGIKTFSNTVPYSKLLQTNDILAYAVPIFLLVIVIVSILTLIIKKSRDEEWSQKLRTLAFFDLTTAVVIYPISDRMHFAVASICTLLTVLYLVHVWLSYEFNIKSEKIKCGLKIFFNLCAAIGFVIYLIMSIKATVQYWKSTENQKYLNHFQYIETPQNLYDAINDIDSFIKSKEQEGKQVIILDSMAAAINIPIDLYYKNYDMFNLGNFGEKGEDGIIEDLKYIKNTLMLLKKDIYKNNWQNPSKIINFVRTEYTNVGEILAFEIYSK